MCVLSLGHSEMWFIFFSPQIYCSLGLPKYELIVFQFSHVFGTGPTKIWVSGVLGIKQTGPQLVVQAFSFRLGLHKDIFCATVIRGVTI